MLASQDNIFEICLEDTVECFPNEGKVSVTGSFSLEATMPAYNTIGAAISTDTDVFLGFGPSISTFPEDTDTDDHS